jgi:hypothetical protein
MLKIDRRNSYTSPKSSVPASPPAVDLPNNSADVANANVNVHNALDSSSDTIFLGKANKIRLNIGGQFFATTMGTLTADRNSMFAAMLSGRYPVEVDDSGAMFIDRDPTHFRHILNFLRDGALFDSLEDANADFRAEIMREARFYQCSGLISYLEAQQKRLQLKNSQELTSEKRWKLLPNVSAADLSSKFAELTAEDGYEFHSWVQGSQPGSVHMLFAQPLSRSDVALFERLGLDKR